MLRNRRYLLRRRPETLPGPEHFQIDCEPLGALAPGEVRTAVEWVALSPWQGQRLKDFSNYVRPFEIGELIDCDVAGTVRESRDPAWAVGQRVTGRLGWQTHAVSDGGALAPIEDGVSEVDALVTLSSPGLTAYTALDLFARPMPGQTMVVTSAAGAVGSFAVQLGRLAGMRVVGIAGGAHKTEVVKRRLGADAALDYRDPEFERALGEALPDGVHLVFDTVGGPITDKIFEHLAKHADVLIVGRSASNNSADPATDYVNMRQLWAREARVHCFSRYSYPQQWAHARERMMALARDDKVAPLVQVVDGFEQIPHALHDMLDGRYTGKVLVRLAPDISEVP